MAAVWFKVCQCVKTTDEEIVKKKKKKKNQLLQLLVPEPEVPKASRQDGGFPDWGTTRGSCICLESLITAGPSESCFKAVLSAMTASRSQEQQLSESGVTADVV